MGDTNCTNTRSQCTNSLQAWNYNGMCMNIRSTSFLHTPNTSDNWLHYLRRWGRSRYLCRATGSFVSLRRRRPCPLLCFALLCFALRIHILVSLFKSFDVHVIISVSISSCTTEGHQRLPIQHGSLHSKTRRTRHAPPHFQGTSSVQGLLVALLRRCCRFCECLNCGRRFYRCLCGAIRRRSAADTFPSVHTNAARAAAPAGRVAVGRPVAVVRLRRRRRGCAAAAAPERAVPRRGRPAAGRGRRPPAGPGHAAGVRGRGAVVHVAGGGGAAREAQPPLPPSRALLTRSRSARQVPPLLEVVSVTRVPPVVLERLATRTASSVCGLLPAIGRAWASVDGSLFLWRYDVECVPRSRCDARRCLSFLPRLTLVRLFARAATRRRSKRRSAPTTS